MLNLQDNGVNELPAGYFGKLPSFADFIKYNAAGTELLSFDRWIQEGLIKLKLTLRTGWDKLFSESSGFQFFYNDSISKSILMGNMYPSRDKSGRLFPFLVFIKKNNFKSAGNKFHSVPLLLKPFLNNAWLIYEEAGSAENLGELNSKFERGMFTPVNNSPDQDFKKFLNSENVLNFIERNFRSKLNPGDLREIIKNAVSKGQDLLKPFAIKINLARENSSEDASFFISLFEKKISSGISSVFWSLPRAGSQPSIFIFCGKLVPRNFVDLFYPQNKAEELININPAKTFNDLSFFDDGKNNIQAPSSNYTLHDFIETFN